MCSRHTLHHPVGVLAQYFGVAAGPGTASESFAANYNIAPSHNAIVIVKDGERRFVSMAAGLISATEDRSKRYINARAETIDELPTFRTAFRKRRCLIPMSGFYEPDHVTNSKDPYYFCLENDRPFVCAGIYEISRTETRDVYSYAIITVPANPTVSAVHDRMPAMLDDGAQLFWLDPDITDHKTLKTVLRPYAGRDLLIRRVKRSLYKNIGSGPECIEPCGTAPEQPSLFTGLL